MTADFDLTLLRRAVAAETRAAGHHPFGALVSGGDPTQHAELLAAAAVHDGFW